MKITLNDIGEYWKNQLFPESYIDSDSKLDIHLKNTLGKTLKQLEKEYISNTQLNTYKINFAYNENIIGNKIRDRIPLYNFIEPLINEVLKELYQMINAQKNILCKPSFYEEIILELLQHLSQLATRTLVLALNFAREEGKLQGKNSEERYKFFVDQYLKNSDNLTALYNSYPVLVTLIKNSAEDYKNYIKEILEATEKDYKIFKEYFGITTEKIRKIKTGTGDLHGGKSVSLIIFDDEKRILYKPRNAQVEQKFNEFLDFVNKNKNSNILKLSYARIYSKERYSWVEYIEFKKCKNESEIRRYYIRMGQLLALLYLFNAVDFHYENLIAHGEYPIPIDLETIMHPLSRSYDMTSNIDVIYAAYEELNNSVLNTGLLPHNVGDVENDKVLDISGLSCMEKRITPFEGTIIKDIGKDTMSIGYGYTEIYKGKNSPVEETRGAEYYISEIKNGFFNMYEWLIINKKIIKQSLKKFENLEIRVLFRATYMYTRMLNTSLHPDILSNESTYNVFLSRIGLKDNDIYRKIEKSEIEQLKRQYIPYFTANTTSKGVKDLEGNTIPDILNESPIEKVYKKLDTLCEENLKRELKYIDMSFSSSGISRKKDITDFKFNEYTPHNIDYIFEIALAKQIGDYLIDISVKDNYKGNSITWVSCVLSGKNEGLSDISPIGLDLYNGNSGIAIFFTYLWYITRERKYLDTAIKACIPICKSIENVNDTYGLSIGMYSGISGKLLAIYTLHKLSNIDYFYYIEKCLSIIEKEIMITSYPDVIDGIAGAISVLLLLAEDPSLIKLSKRIRDIVNSGIIRLEKLAITNGKDKGWINYEGRFYTGYAHGNAGILTALIVANNFKIKDRFSYLCDDLLRWEREFYSASHQNWIINSKSNRIGFGWCHGTPGILLSKLAFMLSDYKNPIIEQEFQVALSTTINKCFGNNPSLCHGDLGNLQIVHFVAQKKQDELLERQCRLNFQLYAENIISKRWKGSSFRGTESVGLMIGLSGFGYSLLRFCRPDVVPMILCPIF